MATEEFKSNLKEFADLLGTAVKTVVEKVTQDLANSIVERTPVDTGRARASWGIGVGAPVDNDPGAAPGGGKTESGEPYFPAPPMLLPEIDGKKPIFITSNVDYMEKLENGSSKRSPEGMVRVSIAEVQAEIDATVAAIKSELE